MCLCVYVCERETQCVCVCVYVKIFFIITPIMPHHTPCPHSPYTPSNHPRTSHKSLPRYTIRTLTPITPIKYKSPNHQPSPTDAGPTEQGCYLNSSSFTKLNADTSFVQSPGTVPPPHSLHDTPSHPPSFSQPLSPKAAPWYPQGQTCPPDALPVPPLSPPGASFTQYPPGSPPGPSCTPPPRINRLIIFNTSPTSSRPCCIPSTHHSHFRSPYTHMSCILRVMHGTRVGPRTVISLHIRAMHGTRVGPRTIITLSMRTDWCV